MIVVADNKRRVVLPRPAEPGDAFQCLQTGERFVLVRLRPAAPQRPPVAKDRLDPKSLKGIDLDALAFTPMADEGLPRTAQCYRLSQGRLVGLVSR